MKPTQVLLFKTFGRMENMASLHASDCQMVHTAGSAPLRHGTRHKKGTTLITENVEAEIADLEDRGYKVKRCKCLRRVEGHRPSARSQRNARSDDVVVANPGEAYEVLDDKRPRLGLFRMWAGAHAPHVVYVWAEHFEDAFEILVEWLDDNAPGLLTKLDENDYKRAAEDKGIAWKPHWPDWDDRQFQKVAEAAEADLTVIGHTTLTHGTHIASYEWGGDEVSRGDDEWKEALAASYEDPDGPEYPDFEDEASSPTKENGYRISLDNGEVTATEWNDIEAATGEDQPEDSRWSWQQVVIGLRDLMNPSARWRGTSGGDKGADYGDLATMTEAQRKDAIIEVALSRLGYGPNDERYVDGLFEDPEY